MTLWCIVKCLRSSIIVYIYIYVYVYIYICIYDDDIITLLCYYIITFSYFYKIMLLIQIIEYGNGLLPA